MASDAHRSAAEIEREIEDERNALSRTLDEIQDRLSFEALSSGVVDRVRENGSEVGRMVGRGVRDNPVPLALTALGLTWLAVSQMRGSDDGYDEYGYSHSPYPPVTDDEDYRYPAARAPSRPGRPPSLSRRFRLPAGR